MLPTNSLQPWSKSHASELSSFKTNRQAPTDNLVVSSAKQWAMSDDTKLKNDVSAVLLQHRTWEKTLTPESGFRNDLELVAVL